MIQFNLLPDVKLAYIKAERSKKMTISISVIASIVAVSIFVILFLAVNVLQKKNISDLNGDIKTANAKIQSTPNLSKVLTIQNQLSTLTGLHDKKPAASRLYNYLGQLTPTTVTVSNVSVDFTQHTFNITGGGATLDNINTYVDTLKFTTFTTNKDNVAQKAFSNVVLSGFSRSSTGATYTIVLSYNPIIFDTTNQVTFTVPTTITTRSVTELPNLFKKQPESE